MPTITVEAHFQTPSGAWNAMCSRFITGLPGFGGSGYWNYSDSNWTSWDTDKARGELVGIQGSNTYKYQFFSHVRNGGTLDPQAGVNLFTLANAGMRTGFVYNNSGDGLNGIAGFPGFVQQMRSQFLETITANGVASELFGPFSLQLIGPLDGSPPKGNVRFNGGVILTLLTGDINARPTVQAVPHWVNADIPTALLCGFDIVPYAWLSSDTSGDDKVIQWFTESGAVVPVPTNLSFHTAAATEAAVLGTGGGGSLDADALTRIADALDIIAKQDLSVSLNRGKFLAMLKSGLVTEAP